ncbi:hypothetical protein BJX62DRAFT_236296 [Aspergillus germanicus]
MSSETLIPILVRGPGAPTNHQVMLIDETTSSFEDLASHIYANLHSNLDTWVEWNQPAANKHFPRETYFQDGNVEALLKLVKVRNGVNFIGLELNEIEGGEEDSNPNRQLGQPFRSSNLLLR